MAFSVCLFVGFFVFKVGIATMLFEEGFYCWITFVALVDVVPLISTVKCIDGFAAGDVGEGTHNVGVVVVVTIDCAKGGFALLTALKIYVACAIL